MVAVAMSGVFGRYLYIQIPRNIRGDEVSFKELEEEDRRLSFSLQKDFELTEAEIGGIIELVQGSGRSEKFTLFLVLIGDLKRKWRSWKARRLIRSHYPAHAHHLDELVRTASRKSLLQVRIARLRHIHQWFHYWHVIHRPFAFVMYLIMLVHVVVALLFGISWRTPS